MDRFLYDRDIRHESVKYSSVAICFFLTFILQPWRENVLHNNKIRPTVDWLTFNWEDRHLDFDVLKKPPTYFGKPAPVTIHAAGDTLAKEQAEFDKIAENIWKNKLVVDHPRFKTHR